MRLSTKSALILCERVLAAFTLLVMWGGVALLALFIRITGGRPIIVTDEWITKEGAPARAYRFRTTGSGLPVFRFVGRIIRQHSFDEILALYNVVCGEVRLRELSFFKNK